MPNALCVEQKCIPNDSRGKKQCTPKRLERQWIGCPDHIRATGQAGNPHRRDVRGTQVIEGAPRRLLSPTNAIAAGSATEADPWRGLHRTRREGAVDGVKGCRNAPPPG